VNVIASVRTSWKALAGVFTGYGAQTGFIDVQQKLSAFGLLLKQPLLLKGQIFRVQIEVVVVHR
jgi:hypothetical protein